MKRVPSEGGFTIIETMIVLAVSMVLFLSAVLLVAGQQRKVEFTQSVNETRSQIEQTITEIGAGYYPNGGNIVCNVSGVNLNIVEQPNGTAQGSNTGCIFLGKAIQMGNNGNAEQFVVHTIAGMQDNDGTLDGANPKVVDVDGTRETKSLRSGVRVVGMRYVIGGIKTKISTVAFVNGLGQVGSDSQLVSGTQQMSMVPVQGSGTVPGESVDNAVAAMNNNLKNGDSLMNPNGGVEICLASGGTKQWGLITIGSNGRNLSVKLDIKSTDCSV